MEFRPYLFECIDYCDFEWDYYAGLVPRFNSGSLSYLLSLRSVPYSHRVGAKALSSGRSSVSLAYRTSAYNFLSFTPDEPETTLLTGEPSSSSGYSRLYIEDESDYDVLLLLLNGQLAFLYWTSFGDDLNVTKAVVDSVPFVEADETANPCRIKELSTLLESGLKNVTNYMVASGKKIGRFDTIRLRYITDHSDRLFAEVLGFDEQAWEEVLLHNVQLVRTDFTVEFED